MGVRSVDNIVSQALSDSYQQNIEETSQEDPAEAARRKAAKKLEQKKEDVKQKVQNKEVFSRTSDYQAKAKETVRAQSDPMLKQTFQKTIDNKAFNKLLTGDQKEKFFKAMTNNPKQAGKGAEAFNRLANNTNFAKSITTSQQAGTLMNELTQNPGSERVAEKFVKSPFMQNAKTNKQVKNQALNWGMKQAAKGNQAGVDRMLSTLNSKGMANMPANGQKGVLNTFKRAPTDSTKQGNIDKFVNNSDVQKMASNARGKATELLGKTGGDTKTKNSFEGLASDKKFQVQSGDNQGRFFSTVATGRPSEYRAISDTLLSSLQSADFPNRQGQVSKFLKNVSTQVKSKGATNIDTKSALQSAKSGNAPRMGKLISMDPEEMTEDEMSQARSQNMATLMKFSRDCEKYNTSFSKSMKRAKFLEDLTEMGPPARADLSVALESCQADPELASFAADLNTKINADTATLGAMFKKTQLSKRGSRRPPSTSRAAAKADRPAGKTERYFRASASQSKAAANAFFGSAGGAGTATTTSDSSVVGGLDLGAMISDLVADTGGVITSDVARGIAQNVASAVANQVLSSLQGVIGDMPIETSSSTRSTTTSTVNIKSMTDQWGIPRSFDADLGGKAVLTASAGATDTVKTDKYRGATIVTPSGSPVRSMADMADVGWSDLSKGELALLKNLGWDREMWNGRMNEGARWPTTMSKTFNELSPVQRESARKLGFTQQNWDSAVSRLTGNTSSAAPENVSQEATRDTASHSSISDMVSSAMSATSEAESTSETDHPIEQFFDTQWKDLPADVKSALSSIGWSPISWRLRTDSGKWPTAMNQSFANLSPDQQRKLRDIGVEGHDWDTKVQALSSGQNA